MGKGTKRCMHDHQTLSYLHGEVKGLTRETIPSHCYTLEMWIVFLKIQYIGVVC